MIVPVDDRSLAAAALCDLHAARLLAGINRLQPRLGGGCQEPFRQTARHGLRGVCLSAAGPKLGGQTRRRRADARRPLDPVAPAGRQGRRGGGDRAAGGAFHGRAAVAAEVEPGRIVVPAIRAGVGQPRAAVAAKPLRGVVHRPAVGTGQCMGHRAEHSRAPPSRRVRGRSSQALLSPSCRSRSTRSRRPTASTSSRSRLPMTQEIDKRLGFILGGGETSDS